MTTVDIKGADRLMNIHVRTAEKMIARGILPAARIGRAYVLMERDVLAYIEAQITSQTAQKREKGAQQGDERRREAGAAGSAGEAARPAGSPGATRHRSTRPGLIRL